MRTDSRKLLVLLAALGAGAAQTPHWDLFAGPVVSQRLARGTGLIAGRVIDGSTGAPIPGARVMLRGTSDWVVTDSEGRYVYFDVPAGHHQIVVSKPGYASGEFGQRWSGATQPIEIPWRRSGIPPPTLALEPGQRIGTADIRLWKFGVITGRVVNEGGDPIVGRQVQAWARNHQAGRSFWNALFPRIGWTDDRGEYRISELLTGEYVVVVPMPGVTLPAALDLTQTARTRSSSLELVRLQRLYEPPAAGTFGLLSPHDRSGTVRGDWRSSLILQPEAASDAQQHYPFTYYPGSHSLAGALAVRVTPGELISGIDLELRPVRTHRISGVLRGPAGPISHATVTLKPLDSESIGSIAIAATSAGGEFVFLAIPPGSYRLEFFDMPITRVTNTFQPANLPLAASVMTFQANTTEPAMSAETVVELGDADLDSVVVTARPAARIAGQIVFDGQATRPSQTSIALELDRADGRMQHAEPTNLVEVDDSDRFVSIGIRPGKYLIRARASYPWVLQSAFWHGQDVSCVPLQVVNDSIEDLVVTLMDQPTVLTGHVRGANEALDVAAVVMAFPTDRAQWLDYGERPRRISLARPDSTGTYEIRGLPPGEYLIGAFNEAMLADLHTQGLFALLARTASRIRLDAHERTELNLVRRAER